MSTTGPRLATRADRDGHGETVLAVRDLSVRYETRRGPVRAVDAVSFEVARGEVLGLVGESGCGKSTTALAMLNLLEPPAHVESGVVEVAGVDVLSLQERELRKIRGSRIALVPQGAMSSLNPVTKIGTQFAETIVAHEGRIPRRVLRDRLEQLLHAVDLPGRVLQLYPHELSGGMKQRICIAMAVALNPAVIVADEPTSALDVVVQRVVAETLLRIRDELGVALVLIGHDFGLQAQVADRVAVMYAGRIVSLDPVVDAFENPCHPYTELLITSAPTIAPRTTDAGAVAVAGNPVASVAHPPGSLVQRPDSGCAFRPRCPHATDRCATERPDLRPTGPRRTAACHLNDSSPEL